MRALIIASFLLACLAAAQPGFAQPKAVTHIWFKSPPEIAEGGKLINEGRVEEGIAVIRKVIHKGLPLDIRAHANTNLCGGYLKLGNYKKAIRMCKRAIKVDAQIWQAFSNRGAARYALGQYAGAAEDFRRAIALDPENAALKENLALAEEGERGIVQH